MNGIPAFQGNVVASSKNSQSAQDFSWIFRLYVALKHWDSISH